LMPNLEVRKHAEKFIPMDPPSKLGSRSFQGLARPLE
jgi:hypothetical protein